MSKVNAKGVGGIRNLQTAKEKLHTTLTKLLLLLMVMLLAIGDIYHHSFPSRCKSGDTLKRVKSQLENTSKRG